MLQTVSEAGTRSREIENVIKTEASICYRLLRYLNSSSVFILDRDSLHTACIVFTWRAGIRRWVRLVATLGAAQDKSTELVTLALVRPASANCCHPRSSTEIPIYSCWACFLLLTRSWKMPMATILENIAIDQETKSVFAGWRQPVAAVVPTDAGP